MVLNADGTYLIFRSSSLMSVESVCANMFLLGPPSLRPFLPLQWLSNINFFLFALLVSRLAWVRFNIRGTLAVFMKFIIPMCLVTCVRSVCGATTVLVQGESLNQSCSSSGLA